MKKQQVFDTASFGEGWNLTIPLIQGGMGVGVSLSKLAGAVAKEGAMGIISTAQIGFDAPDFVGNEAECNLRGIRNHIKRAKEIAGGKGMVGVNVMVALKHYREHVKEAVCAGADAIICGAGLPLDLPGLVAGSLTKIAPIVSSKRALVLLLKAWDKKYQRIPDFVVVEGPDAGGHLGFTKEQLADIKAIAFEKELQELIEAKKEYELRYQRKIPVFVAGGIWDHEDAKRVKELGADGVQAATRFVATKECDASEAYKMAYVNAKKEDVKIIKSPVGMPGRAIKNAFLKELEKGKQAVTHCYQCLEHCDPAKIPYCITQALVNAARGDEDHALIFCGGNAWRAEKIETVEGVMRALCEG